MPCRNDYPEETIDENQHKNKDIPDWMLCEAMEIIKECGKLNACSKELQKWWKNHDANEQDRVKKEAAQKLTPRERELLGIDSNGNKL